MHDYYSYRLPSTFNNFFKSINKVHQCATRLASKKSYYLPKAWTNYGKFNIRFSGTKLWNAIKEDLKSPSRFRFEKLLKKSVISKYCFKCTLYAANCVHSRCFVLLLCLFVCVFVYLLQLIYFFFVCLCVHLFIYNNFDI